MAQKTKFHLAACPANSTGLSEDCSCDKEVAHYLHLAKFPLIVSFTLLVGGALTGSGSLNSEGVHQLVDSFEGITNALVSYSARRGNEDLVREIGARTGAGFLLWAGVWIITEGLERIQDPQPVSGWMMAFAVFGFCMTFYLRDKHHHAKKEHINKNHIIQDWHFLLDLTINSAVLIGGAIMWLKGGWYFIDGYVETTIGIIASIFSIARIFGFKFHTHSDESTPHIHKDGEKCSHKH